MVTVKYEEASKVKTFAGYTYNQNSQINNHTLASGYKMNFINKRVLTIIKKAEMT